MTDFVIDANVLMSILISGKVGYRPILSFNSFILPDFAFVEVEKYKDVLKNKTKVSETQFTKWTYFVFTNLTILPQYVLEKSILDKSEQLLEKVDLKDISYVALAMQLDLPLLTRDKPLYKGLRKQGFRKVQLFDDYLRSL
ncbi:PIN domain-containing protein [Tunicatimonas pelagia]|uniref:PIN domain-containing protein n=1 Tax=Tunicatimonas pelagia TaxID=931531 RepID=UPI00266599AF|nr:PIN domain-containing protein [Tunicatimonas pelagia]WKN41330.1 PIN domain-containing protein [Tunicatimonas pelagia]